jgi:hypothetical protein
MSCAVQSNGACGVRAYTFEVVVCSTVSVGGMPAQRWYIESLHEALREARDRFAQVSHQWPDERLVVALVQSEFNDDTRLFRDVVIEASDRGVLFSRRQTTPLSREARAALHQAFGRPRAKAEPLQGFEPSAHGRHAASTPQLPLALAIAGGLACIALAIGLR